MADTYEKDLAQKSSLTASDFIRVVGSDNVSYKQPVDDVLNGIPSHSRGGLRYLPNTDFDTITNGRVLASGSNSPTGSTGSFFYVNTEAYTLNADGTVNAGFQIAYSYSSSTEMFIRRKSTNANWDAWQKVPTRAEVNTLNSLIKRVTLSSSSPAQVSIPAQSRYATFIITGFAQSIGAVMIGITINAEAITSVRNLMTGTDFSSSYLTFSYANGVLTISSTNSSLSIFTIVCG